MNDTAIRSNPSQIAQPSFLTTSYSELCRSYQGLREFRMKLLGILPIASVVGLLALGKALPPPTQPELKPKSEVVAVGKSIPTSPQPELPPEVVGYIGIFSGILTLALFGYEVRGLLMCHDYSVTGASLEAAMGIRGQFTLCDETRHFTCYRGSIRRSLALLVNDKVTSSLVYSFVFSSWFFVGLKWTFNLETEECVWWAVGLGAAVAGSALLFLGMLTRESKSKREDLNKVLKEDDKAVFVVFWGD